MKTDDQIQQDVLNELRWDTRVDGANLWVAVDRGIVTLGGTVGSVAAKIAAQDAAHRVAGVLDVANDLQVQPPSAPSVTDTDIAYAIRRALEWDVSVPAERIRTTVTQGVVTLEGSVDVPREREDAEQAVRRLVGVRGVNNRITVTAPVPEPDPQAIRTAIEAALARQARQESDRIRVTVHDGTVTLAGAIRSWSEKRAMLALVGHAPGVRVVEDQLVVGPLA